MKNLYEPNQHCKNAVLAGTRLLLLLSLLSLYLQAAGQNVPKTLPSGFNNLTGYFEHLPQGYDANPSKKYPLLIVVHGVGELAGKNGTTLERKVLKNGPPRYIEQGTFPASFTVNGKEHSFIVVTPQFKEWPGSGDIHRLVDYLKTQRRIDADRLYVTGLSMGGGVTWGAISEDQSKAKQYAAAVIVCGAYSPDQKLANVIARDKTPVWALHNSKDPTVPVAYSEGWVADINKAQPAPNPPARLTIFPSSSHDAWSKSYDPAYKENGMNVYEWMLQYAKGTATPTPDPPAGNRRITVPTTSGRQLYYPNVMKSLNAKPGDTLCIAAGDYDYIYFANLQGTADKPVIIMNCGGLVRVGVNSSSTNGAFVFSNSKYFKVEGTGAPGVEYGFDVNGTNAKGTIMFGFFLGDGCSDFDLHHIYIHDAGTFVQAKTLQQCGHPEWLEGSFVMRNVKLYHLLCRNAAWEGFYIGNTHYLYSAGSCKDMKSHHIENLQVYDNDLENMGSDGIQISMADMGTNLVHHNRVVNYATSKNAAHGYGILSGGGSTLRIYNNRVDKGYNCGIQIFGSGINYVYNNVVSNIEYEGINVTDKLVFQPATGYIYNNTIYNTDVNAVKIYADLTTVGHKLYNNLVIAKGTQWDYPEKGFYIRGAGPIKFDVANNISLQDLNQAFFEDAGTGNVHLTSKSTAVNRGRDMKDFQLDKDMDDHNRPQDSKYDVGAYEFSGPGNVAPEASAGKDQVHTLPITLVVQLDGSASKDTDGKIESYSWKKKSGPVLGTIVTPTTAKTTLIGLVQGTYVYELTVTDDDGATGTDEVVVTVQAPAANKPPTASAGSDITIVQPASSVQLDGSGSADEDGSISKYEWKKISGPAGETISAPNSGKTNVTGLVPGAYVFELTVTDDDGETATDRITVTVNELKNDPPVAKAGADITITLPVNNTQLDGSASGDTDGSIDKYAWRKVSGPTGGAISGPAAAKTNITGLTAGTYVYELTVTDDKNATASDRITVTVLPANKPPVADAGSDVSITLPQNTVHLNGSASADPDGSISEYSWAKVSGPAATISSPTARETDITGLTAGTYVFELTVTDDDDETASARVTVTVHPANKPPVANAGSNISITLPAASVQLDGSGSKDSDGSITKYVWTKISGPAGGAIASAGTAKTDITNLSAGTYVFELTVTDDDNATDNDRVTVVVTQPAANKPPVANAGTDITITAPASSVHLDGSASSDDDGSITDYAWKKISGPAASIASPANAETDVTGLTPGTYVFELSVTDDDNESTTDRIRVIVEPPANKAPDADAGTDVSLTLPVNSVQLDGRASSDPDGSISAYAWKKISGPAGGAIGSPAASVTNITGLTTGTYVYQLTVTDDDGATASDRVTITVAPAPPNEPPTANAGGDRSIQLPATSVLLDGSASNDPDGTITAYAWKQVSGPATANIGSAHAGTTNVSGLIQAGTYVFELKVTDDKNATASDRVSVTVTKAPNQRPVAGAGADKQVTLPDNTVQLDGNGSNDPDGSISTYTWTKISGPAGGDISHPDNVVTNVTGLLEGTYEYQLTITDNEGATASDRVIVTVLPPVHTNKAPVAVTSADQNLQLPLNYLYINGRSSSDPDGVIASYAWKQVSGPATAVIAHADWAETRVSELQAGIYVFELKVTDNEGATATDNVTVTVLTIPGNEAPIAVSQGNQVIQYPTDYLYVNGRDSHDPDGTIATYTWKQLSGPDAAFIWHPDWVETRVSGLKPGKYEFELTVTDNKQASSSTTFTVDVLADKTARPPVDSVSMWPNPAINFLRMAVRYLGRGEKLYFSVYDMTGRSQAVFTHPLTAQTLQKDLDISHLPAGYYMMEIKDEKNEFRWVGKFLKAGN